MWLSRNSPAIGALMACAFAASAAAQPSVPAATARVGPTGSIAGTVRNATSDMPIARARVIATSAAGEVPHVAVSGIDGRYVIAALPPGNYTITVSRTGFATEVFGHRAAAAAQVNVSDGQKVTPIDVALTPAGAIAGRILDEDGAPFAGATVTALASRFENGQHMLVEVASVRTDDRGEFRVFGLAPGQYYLSAADPAFATVASERGTIRYTPTYYPGTSFADEARPLTVTAGGDAPRAEFTLRLTPPAWVSGQLLSSDKHQLLSAALIMTPLDPDGSPVLPSERVDLLPDGRFTFAAVPPGHYLIRARGQTEPKGAALFRHYAVIVSGQDIEHITMTLRPGALLDGSVAFEAKTGAKPPQLTSIRVRAPLTDGSAFGDALTGTVRADRTYAIRGLMDGKHQVVVEGLQAPWVVKAVTIGGTDITDLAIDAAEGQQFRDVRVTITDQASEVHGRVRTERQAPAADAPVLVFPVAPQFWLRTNRRMRIARTDANGEFAIYGLPPGEYFAVASSMLDEGDLGRPRVLTDLAALATSFTIPGVTSRQSVDLRLASSLLSGSTR